MPYWQNEVCRGITSISVPVLTFKKLESAPKSVISATGFSQT